VPIAGGQLQQAILVANGMARRRLSFALCHDRLPLASGCGASAQVQHS